MDIIEILVIVGIVALGARALGFLRGLPVKKSTAGILAIGLVCVGVFAYNWGGIRTQIEGISAPPTATGTVTQTPGAAYMCVGSESDDNVTYANRVFTVSFWENTTCDNAVKAGTTNDNIAMPSATLTITVYRTDSLAIENTTATMSCEVPTFYGKGDNAGILYSPVEKDWTLGEWEVAFTPSGGSALNERTWFTVSQGGSKAVSIVITLSNKGLVQFDNNMSKDLIIHAPDGDFTVRFIKTGECS